MSTLLTAVETIRNEFAKRFAVAPSIYLSVSSVSKMTEATKIVEEIAKELELSCPEHGSRNGIHWVSAARWAPNVEVTVFYDYDKEEDRCSQCPFLKMER